MNRTRRNIIPIPNINYVILNIQGITISNPLKSRNIKTLTELQTMPGYSERLVEQIESTKLDNKYQLYAIEDDIIVCIVSFIINQDNSDIGYIDYITSDSKSKKYKPTSFLAFYQVFHIFDNFNIKYCYLSVSPDPKQYWKLYEFYSTIGFLCLPTDKRGRPKINNIKELSPNNRNLYINTRGKTNTFLKNHKNTTKRNIKNQENYIYNCENMVGNVKVMMEKMKQDLHLL